MANPFLVLGGIAVGIIAAGFGILQVPGWVASAQDAAAVNDLSSAAITEAALASTSGNYHPSSVLADKAAEAGVNFSLSNGVTLCVTTSANGKDYAAVARSASGSFFARTTNVPRAESGATPAEALTNAGGLPAGVSLPFDGDDCADDTKTEDSWDTLPADSDLGTVVPFDQVRDFAYTTDRLFAISGNKLVTSGPDKLAHPVVLDGGNGTMVANSIASDEANNLYIAGEYRGKTGVFKLTSNMVISTLWEADSTEQMKAIRLVVSPAGTYMHTEGVSLVHLDSDGATQNIDISATSVHPILLGGLADGTTIWGSTTDLTPMMLGSDGHFDEWAGNFGGANISHGFVGRTSQLFASDDVGSLHMIDPYGGGLTAFFDLTSIGWTAGDDVAVHVEGMDADEFGFYIRIGFNTTGSNTDVWKVLYVNGTGPAVVVMQ